ncbi:ImuA family protein [Rubinisphaera margarita]|uniref:ImuA family protein n=1 Tax=Rubinisphaera margarita TaxID=2909586 RepID=UPI001EE7C576|nr:hypothetical protein [Rubinisphaera margarita]MCG6156517.1 hypothetical protein [Rubinisphaera margarita]
MSASTSRSLVLEQLRAQLHKTAGRDFGGRSEEEGALSRLLPGGRFPVCGLVEWLAEPGSLAGSLAFAASSETLRSGCPIVVIDPGNRFHPPAILRLGWTLDRLLIIRPRSTQEALWAAEQALRCPGIGAVFCLGLDVSRYQANTVYRRFLLAAETGKTLGFLVQNTAHAAGSRWADLRLRIEPLPTSGLMERRPLRIQLEGGRAQGRVQSLEGNREIRVHFDELTGRLTDDKTHRLPVAPPLVHSMLPPGQARA